MSTATKAPKLRPPIKKHGGKFYLAKKIIPLLPDHRVYVEPFLGGGSVLLNKPRAEREIAGDLDAGLINLWDVLREYPNAFIEDLGFIPYEKEYFQRAHLWDSSDSVILRANAYIVRNRFSRGGLGKAFAWSERLRGGKPGDANGWDTIRAELPAIAERVRGVEFHCRPALELIAEFDAPDALIYADPPYHHATRTAKAAYRHEMTHEDHVRLLEALGGCRGKVVLSGYRCDLYDAALSGWERREFSMPNHSGQGRKKQRRVECVWVKG